MSLRFRPGMVALTLVMALSAVACGSDSKTAGSANSASGAAKADYKIAFTGSLSGPTAVAALADLAGFQAYVDALNKRGGANGHQLKLQTFDDKSDVAVASTTFREMLDSGAIADVGETTSAIHAAEAQLNGTDGAVYIAPGFTQSLLLGDTTQPRLFGAGLGFKDNAAVELAFLKTLAQKDGIAKPRIAIVRHPNPAGDDFLASAKQVIGTYGWDLVTTQDVALNAVDASAQAQAVSDSKPDYVLAMVFSGVVPAVMAGLDGKGVTVPVINYTFGADEPVFQRLKSPHYFALRSFAWPEDSLPALTQLHADAKAAGISDSVINSNAFSVDGYIIGMLLEHALNACGDSCDRQKLADTMNGITNFDTKDLSAPISISPKDHRVFTLAKVFKFDDTAGKAVAVTDWIKADV